MGPFFFNVDSESLENNAQWQVNYFSYQASIYYSDNTLLGKTSTKHTQPFISFETLFMTSCCLELGDNSSAMGASHDGQYLRRP